MKIGIEVVTGFLGAGKSAFINSLIKKTMVERERVVVICCEKGKTAIKEKTAKGSVMIINSFNDSESLKKELISAIELYKPHRVIIEYNGTESLSYLYEAIFDKTLENRCKLYTMYFICDGKNTAFYIKNMGEILLPFIQNSNMILINNCNDLNKNQICEGKRILGEINNHAHILLCNDNNGIDMALEESKLIEKESIRKARIKLINYINKW